MNHTKRTSFLLSCAVLATTFLISACGKDETGDPNSDPIIGLATASATVEFLDTGEKVEFSGAASGAFGSGSADTVILHFAGLDNSMRFILMLTPVREGKLIMGNNGFETHGAFFPDTARSSNYLNAYLIGENNIDDNDTEMDGAATFDITSFSASQVKGSFELTMIRNTTIKQNGEVISGDIRRVKITNGKFNTPLYSEEGINGN